MSALMFKRVLRVASCALSTTSSVSSTVGHHPQSSHQPEKDTWHDHGHSSIRRIFIVGLVVGLLLFIVLVMIGRNLAQIHAPPPFLPLYYSDQQLRPYILHTWPIFLIAFIRTTLRSMNPLWRLSCMYSSHLFHDHPPSLPL